MARSEVRRGREADLHANGAFESARPLAFKGTYRPLWIYTRDNSHNLCNLSCLTMQSGLVRYFNKTMCGRRRMVMLQRIRECEDDLYHRFIYGERHGISKNSTYVCIMHMKSTVQWKILEQK